jgi:ribosomal protein L29
MPEERELTLAEMEALSDEELNKLLGKARREYFGR